MLTDAPAAEHVVSSPNSTENSAQPVQPPGQNTGEEPTKRFQAHAKKFHITYKTHLELPLYLEWLKSKVGQLKWYSLVHENGTKNQEIPYAHTHIAFEAMNIVHLSSASRLNYLNIHPNIKTIRDHTHACAIWQYHQKDPILLLQSQESPLRPSDLYQQIIEAPNLVEAVKIAGVPIKTVADVQSIRSNRSSLQVIPSLDTAYSWTQKAPTDFTSLFVTGRTGTGKTRWALAQFQSPLLVSHLDDLKQFLPSLHDGIVFDDMEFTRLNPTECIHMLDWEMPRSLNVKYGSVTIPARTRKIFTSNLSFAQSMPECQDEQYQALCRRIQILVANQPLYNSMIPMEVAPMTPETTSSQELPEYDWEAINDSFPFNT